MFKIPVQPGRRAIPPHNIIYIMLWSFLYAKKLRRKPMRRTKANRALTFVMAAALLIGSIHGVGAKE